MRKLITGLFIIMILGITTPTIYATDFSTEITLDEPGDTYNVSEPEMFTEDILSRADVFINGLQVISNGEGISGDWEWSNVGTHYRAVSPGTDNFYAGAVNFYYDYDDESKIEGTAEQGDIELWNADEIEQPVTVQIDLSEEEQQTDFQLVYNNTMGEVSVSPEDPEPGDTVEIQAQPNQGYKVKYIIFTIDDDRGYYEQDSLSTTIEDGTRFDVIFVPDYNLDNYAYETFTINPSDETETFAVHTDNFDFWNQAILYNETRILINGLPIVQPAWDDNNNDYYKGYFDYEKGEALFPSDMGTRLFDGDTGIAFMGEGYKEMRVFSSYKDDTFHYYFDSPPHEITFMWDIEGIDTTTPPGDIDKHPEAADDELMISTLDILDSWGFGDEIGTTIFFLITLIVLNLVVIGAKLGGISSVIVTVGTTSVFMLTGLVAWWVAILIFLASGFTMISLKGRMQYD